MKNILIVDDSATSRLLFKAALPAGHAYTLHQANDLASTLKAIAHTMPDLMVIDYNMPGHNGAEIARQLLASWPDLKLALLTANTQKAIIDEALACGFRWIIEKPITQDAIASLLAKATQ